MLFFHNHHLLILDSMLLHIHTGTQPPPHHVDQPVESRWVYVHPDPFFIPFHLYFQQPKLPPPSHSPTDRRISFLMDSPSESNGDEPSQSKQTPRSETNGNRHNHRTSSGVVSSNFIGKHRLAAIISQQNQQIQIIQVLD